MKITLNQSLQYNKIYNCHGQNTKNRPLPAYKNMTDKPQVYYTNLSNVTFGMNSSAKFLLEQTDKLLCAYSGREMISPTLAKKIFDKIHKTPNLYSAVNYLFQYQDRYMHNIESQVFDLFNDKNIKKRYGKQTFKDVLERYKPDALNRLKAKQFRVLTSTDNLIKNLSGPVRDMVTMIRDDSIRKMENDTFGRKAPLEMLSRIKTSGKDREYLNFIYKAWYKLPSSSTDLDAFIVSYSKMSHEQICKRLISPSIATIEHIKPQSKNGSDNLSNYLLVSAEYNNGRSSMLLNEYISLHPELNIKDNLQIYIDLVVSEINRKNSPFNQYAHYPFDIVKTLEKETKGNVTLCVGNIFAPSKVIHERDNLSKTLSKKYPIK